jgi:hypothetical protein
MTLPTLNQIVTALDLKVLAAPDDYTQNTPTSGYASDLLSCVMAGAKSQGLWVTLQGHANVVAVAALLELSAVILTENVQPEPDTIAKAQEQGITLLASPLSTYEVVGRLHKLGIPTA